MKCHASRSDLRKHEQGNLNTKGQDDERFQDCGGDDGDGNGVQSGFGGNGSAAGPAPAKDNGVLTPATLKTILINLGYDPKEEKVGDSVIYWIAVQRGGLKYNVNVNISPNGQNVWATVPLVAVPANTELPAARLLKLLELNQTTVGPSHFVYSALNKQIYLNRALENREVTPKMVRTMLDQVTGVSESTREYWDISKWTEMKTVAAPK